jgi:hypothetical protein
MWYDDHYDGAALFFTKCGLLGCANWPPQPGPQSRHRDGGGIAQVGHSGRKIVSLRTHHELQWPERVGSPDHAIGEFLENPN